jgi:tripartite-type tricarboxylate transporter receptor subunit TctC
MKLPRRRLLRMAVCAVALPAVSRVAMAQTYPARPVRVIVGFPPAGGSDIVARLMGQSLAEGFGQPFVIENRPGANSNMGAEAVVRAAPDGYTLLLVGITNAINATSYDKLNFKFIRDITPVAAIDGVPNIMLVHPSFPAKTLPEFIRYAEASPGKINFASEGTGGIGQLLGELFKMTAGINMVHVPYRGVALALTDLMGAQVQVMFASMPSAIPHVRAGKLGALAVTSAARSEALPEVPTVGEFLPGFEAITWHGIGAPKGTSAAITSQLNNEINAALTSPVMKGRLADLGGTPLVLSPSEFGMFIAAETEKWGKVIRAANIKLE